MTTIPLTWTTPPLTKNRVRNMHHHAEAKIRAQAVEEAREAIRAADVAPMVGAICILHWIVPNRRRRDGDGAQPTLSLAIDALVLEGVLPDDSWPHVPHSGVTVHPPDGSGGAMWLTLHDPDGAA